MKKIIVLLLVILSTFSLSKTTLENLYEIRENLLNTKPNYEFSPKMKEHIFLETEREIMFIYSDDEGKFNNENWTVILVARDGVEDTLTISTLTSLIGEYRVKNIEIYNNENEGIKLEPDNVEYKNGKTNIYRLLPTNKIEDLLSMFSKEKLFLKIYTEDGIIEKELTKSEQEVLINTIKKYDEKDYKILEGMLEETIKMLEGE